MTDISEFSGKLAGSKRNNWNSVELEELNNEVTVLQL